MRNSFIIFSLFLVCAVNLSAQVELNGSVDFMVAKGGDDSKYVTNEVAGDYRNPHLSIRQLNFFVFSPITDQFSINVRVQFDTWGTGKLNQPRITLAMLNWDSEDALTRISLGRFISPFGLYPQRSLEADNLFATAPLGYGYFINISEERGYWPAAGNIGIYGPDDVGLTTVYFGGYNTGLMYSRTLIPELLSVDLALTNAAITSQADYTNLQNLGGILHIGLQPVIYWQQGLSLSYGSFMQRAGINSLYKDMEQYTQLVAGTDWILAHSYFELSGEFFYTMWQVPMFVGEDFIREGNKLNNFALDNYAAYVDLKYEPPFFTGSYIAARYDILRFLKSSDLESVEGKNYNPWDNDVDRYAVSIGYKFARSILLKLVYTDQKTANITDPKDESIRGILTVSF